MKSMFRTSERMQAQMPKIEGKKKKKKMKANFATLHHLKAPDNTAHGLLTLFWLR